jgi:hypothetical protein
LDCCHSGGITRSGGPAIRSFQGPADVEHESSKWNAELEMWEQGPLLTKSLNPHFLPVGYHSKELAGLWKELRKIQGGAPLTSQELRDHEAKLYYGQYGDTRRIGRATPLRDLDHDQFDRTTDTLRKLHPDHFIDSQGGKRPTGPYLPLVFMACGETEQASEYVHGAVSYGAFTYALTLTLRDVKHGRTPNLNYGDLLVETARKLQKLGYTQIPDILGPPDQLSAPTPFNGKAPRAANDISSASVELDYMAPARTSLSLVSTRSGARDLPTDEELKGDRVSKERFLQHNRGALLRMIADVNRTLQSRYPSFQALNLEDAWVTMYTEMGLDSNGRIDPDHRHSEGERGLLPLPENIRFWNGQGAPNPNAPMDLKTNVSQFLLYLGQLKNKKVTTAAGFELYRDLFRFPGIQGEPVKEAITLASVVHGYFYSGAYRGRATPPYEQILNGIASGERIDAIMNDTRYIHAGTSILRNRTANIEAALALL